MGNCCAHQENQGSDQGTARGRRRLRQGRNDVIPSTVPLATVAASSADHPPRADDHQEITNSRKGPYFASVAELQPDRKHPSDETGSSWTNVNVSQVPMSSAEEGHEAHVNDEIISSCNNECNRQAKPHGTDVKRHLSDDAPHVGGGAGSCGISSSRSSNVLEDLSGSLKIPNPLVLPATRSPAVLTPNSTAVSQSNTLPMLRFSSLQSHMLSHGGTPSDGVSPSASVASTALISFQLSRTQMSSVQQHAVESHAAASSSPSADRSGDDHPVRTSPNSAGVDFPLLNSHSCNRPRDGLQLSSPVNNAIGSLPPIPVRHGSVFSAPRGPSSLISTPLLGPSFRTTPLSGGLRFLAGGEEGASSLSTAPKPNPSLSVSGTLPQHATHHELNECFGNSIKGLSSSLEHQSSPMFVENLLGAVSPLREVGAVRSMSSDLTSDTHQPLEAADAPEFRKLTSSLVLDEEIPLSPDSSAALATRATYVLQRQRIKRKHQQLAADRKISDGTSKRNDGMCCEMTSSNESFDPLSRDPTPPLPAPLTLDSKAINVSRQSSGGDVVAAASLPHNDSADLSMFDDDVSMDSFLTGELWVEDFDDDDGPVGFGGRSKVVLRYRRTKEGKLIPTPYMEAAMAASKQCALRKAASSIRSGSSSSSQIFSPNKTSSACSPLAAVPSSEQQRRKPHVSFVEQVYVAADDAFGEGDAESELSRSDDVQEGLKISQSFTQGPSPTFEKITEAIQKGITAIPPSSASELVASIHQEAPLGEMPSPTALNSSSATSTSLHRRKWSISSSNSDALVKLTSPTSDIPLIDATTAHYKQRAHKKRTRQERQESSPLNE